MRGDIRIGISGWRYEPWRGTFYPKGLAQWRELEYASRKLNSIEIYGSFYSLQTPDSYRMWRDATPEGVWHFLGSRRAIRDGGNAVRDPRESLTPALRGSA